MIVVSSIGQFSVKRITDNENILALAFDSAQADTTVTLSGVEGSTCF
jgi:hypothetical protein